MMVGASEVASMVVIRSPESVRKYITLAVTVPGYPCKPTTQTAIRWRST